MADLKHRRIVITGAARGIGREIATACASRGAALALFDREEPELTALAARITAGGGTVAAHAADVRDYAAMERGVERAEEVLGGPLDGVVLNAGIAPPARLDALSPELWNTMIDINLNGCFCSYKACEASLLRSTAPRRAIVVISSGSAFTGSGAGVHYAASKAGQIGMMLGLARALGPRGIGVNAIAPRTIGTPMLEKLYPSQDARDALAAKIPLGRVGTPKDVADTTVFLLSEDAAFIHGQTITVDGGRGLG